MSGRRFKAGILLLNYALALLGSGLLHDHSHTHHVGTTHVACSVDLAKTETGSASANKKHAGCCGHHHHVAQHQHQCPTHTHSPGDDGHHDHSDCQVCQFLATPLLTSPTIVVFDVCAPLIDQRVDRPRIVSSTSLRLPSPRGPPTFA